MDLYAELIQISHEEIKEAGRPLILRKKEEKNAEAIHTHEDFGNASFYSNEIEFSSDISEAIEIGNTIRFQDISEFSNRGPFKVQSVSGNKIQVDKDLSSAVEEGWIMVVTYEYIEQAKSFGVPLPPQSVTGQSFEKDFLSGSLQVSRAQDLLIAARDLSLDPFPGDKIQFAEEWSASNETWIVHGMTPLSPDGRNIIWQGVIRRA